MKHSAVRRPAAVKATVEWQAIVLIRIMVGGIFFSEGAQKLIFPLAFGTGYFTKIGIPNPQFTAQLVGYVEVMFGILVAVGIFTRMASMPLLTIILVAIGTTKVPIILQSGVWAFLHEGRIDFCLLLGLIYLLAAGGGGYSYDAVHGETRHTRTAPDYT